MAHATESPPDLLAELRASVTGAVVGAGDPEYDEVRRVWNGMVDRRPLAVVRPTGGDDVATAVALARRHRLPLAVRGGGHSVAGYGTCTDGVVLDLAGLRDVHVDAAAGTVRVAGGATIADVDRATEPHGLAVPLGVISTTGVAGLTLGGGVGWLTRPYGLAADNLLDATVVTADGRTVRATDDPELLWGLRGGGGNFGVVTEFLFRAHPMPARVHASNLVYGETRWRAALTAWERWTRDLPDAMQSIITVTTWPPSMGLGDAPVMLVASVWAGQDPAEGQRLTAALREAAPPDEEETGEVPWREVQTAVDQYFPWGSRAYWRNTSFDRLDEEVAEVLVRRGAQQRWVGTAFDIHHMGGVFSRVPAEDTPFPDRAARFWLNIYGFWSDPADDAAHTAFVRGMAQDMAPFGGSTYVNFMAAPEDAQDEPTAVFGDKATRLRTLKRRTDPENLFRLNHNIQPVGD